MARPIQQIKQDLETLQNQVAEAATELQKLYSDYLQVLSQSVKQQLMLAGYQLCTQIYPDSFLKLSFNQRQQLQQKIRGYSKEVADSLQKLDNAEQPELVSERTELNLLAEMIKNLPLDKLSPQEIPTDNPQSSTTNKSETTESSPEIIFDGDQNNIKELAKHLESMAAEELEAEKPQKLDLRNPEHLIIWQRRIEKNLRQVLNDISSKTNKFLQEADILPNQLPTKVIDMAIQAHEVAGNSQKVNGLPNIISLVVETEKEPKNKKTKVTPISLLRLRLSEIEFTETAVSLQRAKIRSFAKQIEQLRLQYKAKEKEYAIAEAESAWRASWYED